MRLGLLLGLLWGQEGAGADLEPGAFSGNVVVLLNRKEGSERCRVRNFP